MQLLRGVIAGGVGNPVFVNLMMVCILVGGAFASRGMVREAFPEFSLDHIAIEVVYPGASPEDVERTVCTRIEESLRGLRGVRSISSSAQENFGTIWVGLLSDVQDADAILAEVKDRVDQITAFPPEMEKPVIRHSLFRTPVINVAIYGETTELTLKRFGQEVRHDLERMPAISQVSISGVRDDEIVIELTEQAILAYNLSIARVMEVVSQNSLDLPLGVIRSANEEFTLRVRGRRFTAQEYEDLVVINHEGAVVRLGDVATVREAFSDVVVQGRFNGQPSVVVQVFKTPQEDAIRIAQLVRDYISERQAYLPDKISMSTWADSSRDIDGRINMLVKNGAMGIVLVFVTLLFFLDLKMAFWVSVGIPTSFAGALILMYVQGQTLNMISLFALIMVTGIIVDDAIVIAESIHSRRRLSGSSQEAVIEGAHRVALPVLGASITTIIAFVPLLYIAGVMGRFIYVLPVVIIAAIFSSAVESFGILPTHLVGKHKRPKSAKLKEPSQFRRRVESGLERFITQRYRPIYRLALTHRMVTLSIVASVLLVTIGIVAGGRTPFMLMPLEEGNILRARVRFPEGTPITTSEATIDRIEKAALALNGDPALKVAHQGDLVRQTYTILGEFANFMSERGNNLCEVRIELMPAEERHLPDELIIERWREIIGPIHDAIQVTITRQPIGPTITPLEIRILGHDLEEMTQAAQRIEAKLSDFEGLYDIHHDLIPGKRELRVSLKPAARTLGLTLEDVARQLRNSFLGGEAIRLQRGRDQVIVRVRLSKQKRNSITDLEQIRISTPSGHVVPFLEVAEIEWDRGYAFIMHQDGKRRVRIIADVDHHRANAEQVLQALEAEFLDEVVGDYNDMTYAFGGSREHIGESLHSLSSGFILAMFVIYAVLAAMLRSYLQPLVIIVAVPLGLIGVVFGHLLLGLDLTMMSLFGAVALSGVVVNDSLVLLDAINRGLAEGKSVWVAVSEAGELRFRAVILTSISTIMGLMPILLEGSSQAETVKPMAVALCFGLLFSTVLTLIVVPTVFLVLNDLRRFFYWLRYGGTYPGPETVEEACQEAMTVPAT